LFQNDKYILKKSKNADKLLLIWDLCIWVSQFVIDLKFKSALLYKLLIIIASNKLLIIACRQKSLKKVNKISKTVSTREIRGCKNLL